MLAPFLITEAAIRSCISDPLTSLLISVFADNTKLCRAKTSHQDIATFNIGNCKAMHLENKKYACRLLTREDAGPCR